MLRGDWMSVLFIHYEIEPAVLQPHVPFSPDVRDGRAYVSAVAFSQERVRLVGGGPVVAWASGLVANHAFLNLRTYVQVGGESGIFFLAEWVPRRLALAIAPRMFGLPYRLGEVRPGEVGDPTGRFTYRVGAGNDFRPCAAGTLDEFLLERYTAFTARNGVQRRFRVAHAPWPQSPVPVSVTDESLLRGAMPWWPAARLVGANYSPGVEEVRISWPRRLAG